MQTDWNVCTVGRLLRLVPGALLAWRGSLPPPVLLHMCCSEIGGMAPDASAVWHEKAPLLELLNNSEFFVLYCVA